MTETWSSRAEPIHIRFGYKTLLSVALPLNVYRYPLTQVLEPGDPLTPPAHPLQGGEAGFLVLSQPAAACDRRLGRMSGYVRYVRRRYPRYFIDLSGTFESYLAKFSPKTRSTLRRKLRRFAELSGGDIDWREYRSPVEMSEFRALGRCISAKTYQERLLDRGLPADDAFALGMREQAARDRVRGYILFHRGEPVSYLYCPLEQGAVIYRYLGYDPAYARHSVGTVLQMLVLERLFDEARLRFFDFTEGHAEHKEMFATGHRSCADVLYLRPTVKNIALIGLDAAANALGAVAVGVLDRLQLTSRVKRRIRRASLA